MVNHYVFIFKNYTINDKKLVISVYSKPADSHLYLDVASCHPTKSINRISTGVAKRLKQTRSNDNELSKNIQLIWPRLTRSQRRLPELSKKIISNQYQPFSIKEQKAI